MGSGHLKPKKIGQARSTALHVSKHGSTVSYSDANAGSAGLRGVARARTFCNAGSTTCASGSEEAGFEFELGGASPQRGNEMAQSQVRYAAWQSAQVTSGL